MTPSAPPRAVGWRGKGFGFRFHGNLAELVQLQGGELVIGEMEILQNVKLSQVFDEGAQGERGQRERWGCRRRGHGQRLTCRAQGHTERY